MEYRVRYRDIPWGVALTVLPGKIIGTFIIKPVNRFRNNWKKILIRWGKRILFVFAVLVVIAMFFGLLNAITGGEFSRVFLEIWNNFQPPPELTPTPAVENLML